MTEPAGETDAVPVTWPPPAAATGERAAQRIGLGLFLVSAAQFVLQLDNR